MAVFAEANFYKPFEQNLNFAAPQGMYTKRLDPGVCREMAMHWIARKKQGKASFAVTSKQQAPLDKRSGMDSDRMRKKFAKYKENYRNYTDDAACFKSHQLTPDPVSAALILPANTYGPIKAGDFIDASPELENSGYYLISLQDANKSSGHMIAVAVEPDGFSLMDPNVGEYKFALNDETGLKKFIEEWWNKAIRLSVGTGLVLTKAVYKVP